MNKSIIFGVVAFVAFVVVLVWLAGKDGKQATGPDGMPAAERPVSDADRAQGPEDAPVVLVEYSDFQCPACRAFHPIVKQLIEDNPEQLRFVYRNLPLQSIHPNAFSAARAAEAAGKQGKFWEMHDLLFERQDTWSGVTRPKTTFMEYAEELGLNAEQFDEDYDSEVVAEKIRADIQTAEELNLGSTPSFTLNGIVIDTPRTIRAFQTLIDDAAANTGSAAMKESAKSMEEGEVTEEGAAHEGAMTQ